MTMASATQKGSRVTTVKSNKISAKLSCPVKSNKIHFEEERAGRRGTAPPELGCPATALQGSSRVCAWASVDCTPMRSRVGSGFTDVSDVSRDQDRDRMLNLVSQDVDMSSSVSNFSMASRTNSTSSSLSSASASKSVNHNKVQRTSGGSLGPTASSDRKARIRAKRLGSQLPASRPFPSQREHLPSKNTFIQFEEDLDGVITEECAGRRGTAPPGLGCPATALQGSSGVFARASVDCTPMRSRVGSGFTDVSDVSRDQDRDRMLNLVSLDVDMMSLSLSRIYYPRTPSPTSRANSMSASLSSASASKSVNHNKVRAPKDSVSTSEASFCSTPPPGSFQPTMLPSVPREAFAQDPMDQMRQPMQMQQHMDMQQHLQQYAMPAAHNPVPFMGVPQPSTFKNTFLRYTNMEHTDADRCQKSTPDFCVGYGQFDPRQTSAAEYGERARGLTGGNARAATQDNQAPMEAPAETAEPRPPTRAELEHSLGTVKASPEVTEKHNNGTCKPCSYFWNKADGCRKEGKCEFCHLCSKVEGKRRRFERIKVFKAERKREEAAETAAAAVSGWALDLEDVVGTPERLSSPAEAPNSA